MTHAYDKVYLEKARTALARMLDFAVFDLKYELESFWDLFLTSEISARFESGDFTVLVGKSGVELAYAVLDAAGISYTRIKPNYSLDRSEEYWTGWAIAYYQWETGLRFSEITNVVPITQILEMYDPYHEMDIRQFTDKMNELLKENNTDTNLKKLRKALKMSQRELAEESGVPLRTIQQYEQRQKNINKAQADYLARLSRALACNMSDLMEK